MQNPFFSIITVCYNAEKTIAQTIESVLNQQFNDYEYIIIDGNSTDSTLNIVRNYQDRFGDKLVVVSEKDNGIYDAMNKGIRLANGKLIGIINSDDWYDAKTLKTVRGEYDLHKQDGVYYGLLMNYYGDKHYCATGYHHNYLHECIVSHPTCFISKSIYDKYGMFDLQYKLAADYDLIIRLNKKDVPFIFIPQILAHFRMGGSTDINKKKSMVETYKIFLKHGIFSKRKYHKAIFSLRLQSLFRKIVINPIKRIANV